ncbi:MAG TPA: R3H domain-containing nucleic acid-binding protein [Pyrinomonadaceae bacterium]|jgi:spoIIIJ-associated protein
MTEIQENAKEFLVEILKDFRFNLDVSSERVEEGYYFDLTGEDAPFLLNESGELLDALEVLLFQIFGKEIERTERFICDADGFRQTRKAELQAMARFAAQNVRKSGNSFTFGKLNSTERRIIHLTLQTETDLITESVGEGRDRRLRVQLK